jgi:TP901 family phage tail tape measure protein
MDIILDELGNKWNTISKAQQTALAQTVAGTRQYNQLVSLLDNWDKGDADSFVANVATARGASGALQEQADIYAESWEAAQDRVTAAAEKIYSSLINDEFFIDLLNGFEKGLETINGFIEGLGGIEGALGTVSSVFLTMFANKMPSALENFK